MLFKGIETTVLKYTLRFQKLEFELYQKFGIIMLGE